MNPAWRALVGLGLLLGLTAPALAQSAASLPVILARGVAMDELHAVVIAEDGVELAARGFNGHTPDEPGNIKSASKTVMSALIGMAIERGLIEGVDESIADFLSADFPKDGDPRLETITVGDLLSMQAGLAPTSGADYGRWIVSRNWVRAALAQPFENDPGGPMQYSTGSTHLLSAILTRAAGQSSRDSADDWFEPLEGFAITGWERDRQGIYLGGNEMAMSARSLLAFGELYRRGGVTADGTRLLPADWIKQSWTQRTRSIHSGHGYGYGWYLTEMAGEPVRYAWGFGGQMLYVVPSLDLSVVMTSDNTPRPTTISHRQALDAMMEEIIVAVRDDVPATLPLGR